MYISTLKLGPTLGAQPAVPNALDSGINEGQRERERERERAQG